MKTTLAIALFALALSLCNLMGRRGNTSTNANSRSSGEISEATPAVSPAQENSNRRMDAPPPPVTQGVPKSGAPSSSLPGVNHNSAASVPSPVKPPPPKIISGGVLNGKATSLPKPAYPPIARAANASGAVNVQVTVDESGSVISANAVSGHPLLRQSAVSAARQAKFSPTKISGQPVKVTGVIIYNFVMQ